MTFEERIREVLTKEIEKEGYDMFGIGCKASGDTFCITASGWVKPKHGGGDNE